MITEIAPNLFAIKIRLVGNPLKNLNSYVFLGRERNLLIDTGFNQPECLEDLRLGIRELRLDMEKTDIACTHFHSDHSGLAGQIASEQSKVLMGAVDKEQLESSWTDKEKYWRYFESRCLKDGFPEDEFRRAFVDNPAKSLAASRPYEITPLNEGDVIAAGERKLVCIDTPGHTPGHICLYEPDEKIMVLGDHVLFDITPNITTWLLLPNALKRYLESLQKIKRYDVNLPLPGHRECRCSMAERIDELFVHHKRRLEEAVKIIREDPGVNAYTVATRLTWSIRAKSWQDFPLAQKWFAFGEALSHLDFLVEEDVIARAEHAGLIGYTVKPPR
jgi:glyoxylase-like metal-dependent hydrolase (beta-lactamase superfamily II)